MEVLGNFAEVQLALLSIIPRVELADKAVEEEAAHIVAAAAEAKAPVLTGHLQASIGEEGGEVVADTPYARFVEYGTRKMKAEPFLRPARDESELVVREMAEGIYTAATR
jgi:HK97 gp10 family phage protein